MTATKTRHAGSGRVVDGAPGESDLHQMPEDVPFPVLLQLSRRTPAGIPQWRRFKNTGCGRIVSAWESVELSRPHRIAEPFVFETVRVVSEAVELSRRHQGLKSSSSRAYAGLMTTSRCLDRKSLAEQGRAG